LGTIKFLIPDFIGIVAYGNPPSSNKH